MIYANNGFYGRKMDFAHATRVRQQRGQCLSLDFRKSEQEEFDVPNSPRSCPECFYLCIEGFFLNALLHIEQQADNSGISIYSLRIKKKLSTQLSKKAKTIKVY